MKKLITICLVAMLAFTGKAGAFPWMEVGEAGDLPGTAQTPMGIGPLDSISGLVGSGDADMYEIYVTGGGTFSATTVGGAAFDTQLFLFDSSGMGIYANDDTSSGGFQSTLPAFYPLTPTTAGIYYLAISNFNYDPENMGGIIFPSFPPDGINGPTGPGGGSAITGWSGSGFSGGEYTIFLTGASAVPEPATMGLLSLGVLSLLRRKK